MTSRAHENRLRACRGCSLRVSAGIAGARSRRRSRAGIPRGLKRSAQKLMCVCGCNQILGPCNHVGCPYSGPMIKELDADVARNESDDLILQAFVQEYGPNVLVRAASKGI